MIRVEACYRRVTTVDADDVVVDIDTKLVTVLARDVGVGLS